MGGGHAQTGERPEAKIRQGPRAMLIQFASHSTRIAIAASPAPRKIALIRKSMTITTFPPRHHHGRVRDPPMVCTACAAPHHGQRRGASTGPTTRSRRPRSVLARFPAPPPPRLPSASFFSDAPTTTAGRRSDSPLAGRVDQVRSDSVSPTVAPASARWWATQNSPTRRHRLP